MSFMEGKKLAGFCASCLVAAACGSAEEPMGKSYTFVWMGKSTTNLSFFAGKDGAPAKAAELTSKGPDKVTVQVQDAKNDAAVQTQLIQAAVAAKADGIILSAVNASVGTAIDAAVNAGVPVITFDSDVSNSKRLTFYGVDDNAVGVLAAKLLAKKATMAGLVTKTALIVSGKAGSPNLVARNMGFQTQLQALGYTVYPIYDSSTDPSPPASGSEERASVVAARVEQALNAHTDATVLFMPGSWPFRCTGAGTSTTGADSGCTAKNWLQMPTFTAQTNSIVVAVVNDLQPELEAMGAGYVDVAIGQKLWGWGYDTVQMLYDSVKSGKTFGSFTNSGYDLICPNNYMVMQTAWITNDFSQAITPACDLLPVD